MNRKFVLMCGEDIFGDLKFDDIRFPNIFKGLSSDFEAIEVDLESDIAIGWRYENGVFSLPESSTNV